MSKLKETEDFLNEVLKEMSVADKHLSNVADIREQLILPLCGHRKSLEEAFEFTMQLSKSAGKEGMTVMTAVGVVINTIRYELEKAVDADSTFGEKKEKKYESTT